MGPGEDPERTITRRHCRFTQLGHLPACLLHALSPTHTSYPRQFREAAACAVALTPTPIQGGGSLAVSQHPKTKTKRSYATGLHPAWGSAGNEEKLGAGIDTFPKR